MKQLYKYLIDANILPIALNEYTRQCPASNQVFSSTHASVNERDSTDRLWRLRKVIKFRIYKALNAAVFRAWIL